MNEHACSSYPPRSAGGRPAVRRCPDGPLRPLLAGLLLFGLATIHPGLATAAPDENGGSRSAGPWYTDLAGHWAETYVHVLWREGVTPPPAGNSQRPAGSTWATRGPYSPDRAVTPEVFGSMMVRLFPGQPFTPPPAVQALAQRSGPGSFTRLEAMTTLVSALGLESFARSLPLQTVAIYLGLFEDSRAVPPAERPAVATAILLGIVDGYPDNTLRPSRLLSRAEAATLLYRSCLLLAEARPNPFSPDGDGAEDETVISLGSLLNRNLRSWDFFILDSRDRVLKRLKTGAVDHLPPTLTWRGTTDAGLVLTEGVYYYRGFIVDRNGLQHWSVRKPIVLETKSLRGFARPSLVLPGETVVLSAVTGGAPSRLTVALSSFPSAGQRRLLPDDHAAGAGTSSSRKWQTVFRVPPGAEPGQCLATFTAYYPSSTRTAQAVFEVGRFAVRGELRPNPVVAGHRLEIWAWPNLVSDTVQAELGFPGQALLAQLSPFEPAVGGSSWRGEVFVPLTTPPGRYEVTLVARRSGLEATQTLDLEVTRDEAGVTFVLSD